MNVDHDSVFQHLTTHSPTESLAFLGTIGAPRELILELADSPLCRPLDDPGRALAFTAVLTELADEVGDAACRARCRRGRAQALAYASQLEDALKVVDEAIDIAGENDLVVEGGRLRMTRIHALARLGRYDEATTSGEEARQIFLGAEQPSLAARADLNLGQTHRMADDPERALLHFNRARPLLLEEPGIIAQLDNNRAQALQDLSRFDEALTAYHQALDAFRTLGMAQAAAIAEGNLGDVMSLQGRLAGALFHFERARRDINRDESPGESARIEAEQAEAFAGSGLHEEAVEAFRSAIPDLERTELARELGRAQLGLATTFFELNRLDEALATLGSAESTFHRLGIETAAARASGLRGQIFIQQSQLDDARPALESALSRFADYSADATVIRLALARLALSDTNHDAAEQHIAHIMTATEKRRMPRHAIEGLHVRAQLRRAQGRRDDALDDLRRACRIIETQRGRFEADRMRSAFLGSFVRIFEQLLDMLLEDNETNSRAEAFAVIEQSRSRSLLDLMNGTIDVVDALRHHAGTPEEETLLKEIVQLQGRLNAHHAAEHDDNLSIRALSSEEVDTIERQLQVRESRLAATRIGGGLFAPPADLPAIQALLGPTTVLLEYARAGDALVVFVVRRDRVDVQASLIKMTELTERIQRFQFQISRAIMRLSMAGQVDAAMEADARAELQELYDVLVQPVAHHLDGVDQVVIVPFGPMHALPFAALHDGNVHLVERFNITHVPSASLLRHLHNQPTPSGGHSLVVGVADDSAPRIASETAAISRALPSARVLVGADASVDRFRSESAGASLIHLACHGQFVPTSPLSSGLKLADRWLRVREICGLPLAGATIILSGCETGGTQVASGDELTGLPRAFFTAGAACLVMSLWRVDDESTTQLMDNHYRLWDNSNAQHSQSVSTAFQEAQRSLLRQRPHPVFWSPFVVVGKG